MTDRSSRRPWAAAAGAGTAAAVGAAAAGPSALLRRGGLALALVPTGVAAVVGLPLEILATVVIVACQLSGWRVGLAGFHFLPEHFAVAALALALFVRYRRVALRRPAGYEVLLLAWVLWSALTTVAYSVNVAKSMAIVGWMLLAWLILWSVRSWLLYQPVQGRRALQAGMATAAVTGLVAFALWLAALGGLFHFGVQHEFVTGTVAARGLSVEANLFGSLLLCWLVVALRWRVVNDFQVPGWQMAGLVLGIVSSMTRAVWLATILAVAVSLFGLHGRAGRRRRLTPLVWLTGAVLVISLAAPAARKFQATLDFGSSTGAERVKTWNVALDDLGATRGWILGRGTNSFGQRHLSRTVAGQPDYLGNLALTVLYDTGLVGMFLFSGTMLAFVIHRHVGWGRRFKLLFVIALMIVGAAASPIWFGYVWVTVAALDQQWSQEHFRDDPLKSAPWSGRCAPIAARQLAAATGPRPAPGPR